MGNFQIFQIFSMSSILSSTVFYISGKKKVFLEQGFSTLDFGKTQVWNKVLSKKNSTFVQEEYWFLTRSCSESQKWEPFEAFESCEMFSLTCDRYTSRVKMR